MKGKTHEDKVRRHLYKPPLVFRVSSSLRGSEVRESKGKGDCEERSGSHRGKQLAGATALTHTVRVQKSLTTDQTSPSSRAHLGLQGP